MTPFVNLFADIYTKVLLIHYTIASSTEGPTMTTTQGIVEGISLTSRNGKKYNAFYGMRYAKPPIGQLRFVHPQEPDNWEGTRMATEQPPICLQVNESGKVEGEEDCLFVNVFTPYNSVSDSSPLLPTMVLIHGGGMVNGNPKTWNPSYFMDKAIVMVNFQYRVNGFGFLSTGDDVLSGNYGMKDQVAALKWVRKNIAAFGGDPNRVTIFGNSSGGANVHLHMHSPLSKGLFQRAISQSGSALAKWTITSPEKIERNARAFAEISKCPFEQTTKFVECLRKISPRDLLQYYMLFKDKFASKKPFTVVIENESVENAFLTKNPWSQNVVNDVPWMTGLVSGEGGYKALRLLLNKDNLENLERNYKTLFPLLFEYENLDEKVKCETSGKLRQFYFDNNPLGKNPHKLVNIYTDGYYAVPSIEAAKRHRKPFFFYLYDHRNIETFNDIFGQKEYKEADIGVCHADELISLFLTPMFSEIKEGPDFEVSRRMVNYWTNFATNGDPNGEEKVWEPADSNEFKYLHIKTEADVMEKDLWADRFEFWMSLPVFKTDTSDKNNDQE